MLSIKQQLHNLCLAYIQNRLDTAQLALEMANSSANEDTKSSAGDKYETTREMIQQEIDKHSAAISEAVKQKQLLQLINPERKTEKIQPGSLVKTDKNTFYISISAGALTLDGAKYMAVAAFSPIGQQMIDKQAGDSFVFNTVKHQIIEVL
jgi:transcription elongation GreA/GreB family factor